MWAFLTDLECVLFARVVEEAGLWTDNCFVSLEDFVLAGEREVAEIVGI